MKKIVLPVFLLITFLSVDIFADEGIVFIVNNANPATKITSQEISDYYLKKIREWPNGELVRFIDRKKSPVREIFLKNILKKTEDQIDRYWIGQKLSGNSAPVQSPMDSMSIQYVSTFKGAIGYISSSTEIKNENVKTITFE